MRAVIVGSGPSAAGFTPPAGVVVIAVNASIRWLPRADHWFTLDPSPDNIDIMRRKRDGVRYWCACPDDTKLPAGVNRLVRVADREESPLSMTGPDYWLWRLSCVKGLALNMPNIHTGNSAYGALGLAYHLGAEKVALIGVDATTEPKIDGSNCLTDLSHLPPLFGSAVNQIDFVSCGKMGGYGIKQMTPQEGIEWLLT